MVYYTGMLSPLAVRLSLRILADIPDQPPSGQDVIRPFSNPVYKEGHLAILKGNLATEAVAKISGVKTPVITGPAVGVRVGRNLFRGNFSRKNSSRGCGGCPLRGR
jgi:dihydroxyacid dehydratase/phosphogluconate dehydratase